MPFVPSLHCIGCMTAETPSPSVPCCCQIKPGRPVTVTHTFMLHLEDQISQLAGELNLTTWPVVDLPEPEVRVSHSIIHQSGKRPMGVRLIIQSMSRSPPAMQAVKEWVNQAELLVVVGKGNQRQRKQR